jgi:hypothetical protein
LLSTLEIDLLHSLIEHNRHGFKTDF